MVANEYNFSTKLVNQLSVPMQPFKYMELILNLLCSSDGENNSSHLRLVGGFSWVVIKVASTINN